jgi:hypothetical protein
VFFNADEDLNGYSGKSSIYVNYRALDIFFMELLDKLSLEEKLNIFKLNFFRLVVHELTHFALRYVEGNLNSSTPVVLSRAKSKYFHIESGLRESGFISELSSW